MPIENGQVHVPGYYDALAPQGANAYQRMTVQGGTYVGFRLPVRALADAVREARECFSVSVRGPYRRVGPVRPQGPDARRRALAQSPIGAALVRAFTP